jgi:hypothetical protein
MSTSQLLLLCFWYFSLIIPIILQTRAQNLGIQWTTYDGVNYLYSPSIYQQSLLVRCAHVRPMFYLYRDIQYHLEYVSYKKTSSLQISELGTLQIARLYQLQEVKQKQNGYSAA